LGLKYGNSRKIRDIWQPYQGIDPQDQDQGQDTNPQDRDQDQGTKPQDQGQGIDPQDQDQGIFAVNTNITSHSCGLSKVHVDIKRYPL